MKKYARRLIIIFVICVMLATSVFAIDYDSMTSREEAVSTQRLASMMANIARKLGYPESNYIIAKAKQHWWKAQEVINWHDLSVEERCFDFFKNEMSLSESAICGILANIASESAFDYDIDIYLGYGLVGWCGGRRTAALETVSEHNDVLVGQLRHIQKELEGSYNHVLEKLNNVSNNILGAAEAARVFCLEYEAPVGAYEKAEYRAKLAKETYWKEYSPYK